MRRTIITLLSIILVTYLACGSSQKNEPKASESAAGLIHWARFDAALDSSASSEKPVLAYFWRDG